MRRCECCGTRAGFETALSVAVSESIAPEKQLA